MKKILSILMALAMVLTMASFPAFAEGEAVALTAITNPNPQGGFTSDKAVDGDETTFYATSGYLGSVQTSSSSYKLKFELAEKITLDSLELYWAGKGWGYMPAEAYKVYVSEDNVTYTEILSYEGLISSSPSYDGKIVYSGSVGSGAYQARVTETGLNVRDVKYIFVEILGWKYRAALAEVKVTKGEEAELVPTSYTVKYQYEDGTEAASDKVVDTDVYVGDKVTETAPKISGYVADEASKEITLVDGTNEIIFTYKVKVEIPYTVKYVDEAGNPIADDKVVTDFGEGDVISEVAPVISGYFYVGDTDADVVDYTKSLALDKDNAENNVITFTYKKVLPIQSIKTSLLNGATGFWATGRIWDGKVVNKVTDADADQIDNGSHTGGNVAEITFTLGGLSDITKLTAYWKDSTRATAAQVYTSIDGNTWELVYDTDEIEYVAKDYANTSASATELTVQVSEFELEPSVGAYVKYVVKELSGGWSKLYEIEIEGTTATPVELTADNITYSYNWGWAISSITNNDKSLLFDGAAATNSEGFFSHGYYGAETQPEEGLNNIEIDLGGVYTNPVLSIQGGAPDWNYAHIMSYVVYVAGVDGVYGDTPVVGVDKGTSVTADNKVRTDVFVVNAEDIRYIKIVPTYMLRRAVIGEIALYGTASTDIADQGTPIGGSVRLPQGSVTAGLRFGATILKSAIGLEGDYEYDENADVTIGMFLLPYDRLEGNATLADYLVANSYAGNAVKVPAERVFSQDAFSVTYTAVLVGIPSTSYSRDIIAVPYVCDNGEYIFFDEITRNYADVCASVATAYEAGDVELTAEQVALLESVLGRTLVAPEVSEEV